MGNIKLLDEQIANQIAAGEVVERPSSVVKELVENSIDAGATRIDVTIEEGGLQLIRIVDNGSGMESDDCELAFSRHATSKIQSGKDLFAIRTLGFRGEALPSIAAVSKLTCITSSDNTGLGRKLVIHGGRILDVGEVTASRGTDITVSELFYNTPARLKYMKTVQTELGHVSDYMYRLALAHPQIAFTLSHNGNILLQTQSGSNMLQAIAAIYGTAIGKQMIALEGSNLDYTVEGFISKTELTRSNRSGISLIINGRYVRNLALNAAILRGYHTLLPINRFPIVVLQITMDPTLVDVNVHPSKLEVRFSKEVELMEFVETLIKSALGMQVLIPHGAMPTSSKNQYVQEQLVLSRPPVLEDTSYAPKQEQPIRETFRYNNDAPRNSQTPATNQMPGSTGQGLPRRLADLPFESPKGTIKGVAEESRNFLAAPTAEAPQFPTLAPIGQLHGTYLLAQNESGLFLIDQHAAHERMNYEYYYEKFGAPSPASQELLVPLTLEFTPSEAGHIVDKLILLEQVGVFLEGFGGNSFIVRAYPHWFPAGEEKAIIEEMCELLIAEKKGVELAKLREKSAIMCSCKASIKANHALSIAEMEALLDRLGKCNNPYTCPHGRPIVVSFSTYELEKMFKRVM